MINALQSTVCVLRAKIGYHERSYQQIVRDVRAAAAKARNLSQPMMPTMRRSVVCDVSIKTDKARQTYKGLYASTCDAALDAMSRAGTADCAISIRRAL